jgi:hypothetical protein
MSKAKKRSFAGSFLAGESIKPVEPEVSHEPRAIDPARSFQDWLEWLRIVQAIPERSDLKQIN